MEPRSPASDPQSRPDHLFPARLSALSTIQALVRHAQTLPALSLERVTVQMALADLGNVLCRIYPAGVVEPIQAALMRTYEIIAQPDGRLPLKGRTTEVYVDDLARALFAREAESPRGDA
jgi:hypothetical protein